MNKFVYGALAMTAASPLFAGGSETEAWLTLDREIDTLASTLADNGMGSVVTGFIKTSYAHSSDVQFFNPADPADPNDLGGFSLDNARINVAGGSGDYSYYIQADGSSDPGLGYLGVTGNPGGQILDAYASWNFTENWMGTMGNFRPPFLGSALRNENELLFIDRSTGGESWDFRDLGVMVSGSFEQVGIWLAAQNGQDTQGDDLAWAARAAFNALGTGAGTGIEGAYGADEASNLTLAAGFYSDEENAANQDRQAIAVEAAFTSGALYAGAEVVDLDDGFGDMTPWAATVSFMFSPDAWEAALRYEDFDDTNDTTLALAGINRYINGHNAKWQLNFSTVDSDVSANEVDVLALALVVGN